jgi:hypothetical protein
LQKVRQGMVVNPKPADGKFAAQVEGAK